MHNVLTICTLCFISNTFISNARLKLVRNQAKAKQHPKAALLLFENYSLSSSMLSSRNNRRYTKKCTKKVCLLKRGYMINENESEADKKNRSDRYDINRPRPRHEHKYTKYKMSQYNDGYMY